MKLLLLGWLALGLALLWDGFLRFTGIDEKIRVGILVPVSEELIKFSVSYLFNLSPLLLFPVFGFGEGVYESFSLKKRFDISLIIAGILPHMVFSMFYLFKLALWFSLSLAIISHCVWNLIVSNLAPANK